MFVYTVKTGDTLFSISKKFDIPTENIRLVNGLAEFNIVPGQALLMNSKIYIVQPGDTLFSIALAASVSLEEIKKANSGISPAMLQPGMKVKLPQIPQTKISTLGYIYITGTPHDQELIRDFAPYLTYYPFFEYHFTSEGSLSELNDLRAIEAAWRSRTIPLATITNLTQAGFSPQLASQVLRNPKARNRLIENIFALVSEKGYGGVNIDIEGVRAEDRDRFSGFLHDLKERLHTKGLRLSIAVPAKTSEDIPWLKGFDYGAIGSAVDFMFIMAYDWHYLGSEPGPVAPIDQVIRTLEFALERVPRNKILMGVPLYGYDWVIPYSPETSAKTVSNQQAVELAMKTGSPIQYSEEYQSPYFHYTDDQGLRHVVWFEDTRSIRRKFKLVRDYKLWGLGAWQISLGFPQGPWLIRDFFTIRIVK
ncbi:glycosyl hydrolase family 18 protein [Heyndrickxia acidicola]|uniref:Glycosyl hydrolase family 18 protein n=1 Tax=Heyndrickxia acidicola TaxID=209389 RepID=A0ABU6MEB1_9BACI|nr:glycosyl hydrolase family 18 protein [Heyndrickxia acidicola]MED1202999.1 glycosyl hydrolase family 18 protein [Heyndrickxia acidicola]